MLKLSFFLNQKNNWIIPTFNQQMFSLSTMTMNLFLLEKEFDPPNDNLNHHDIHNCENQDDILIHATNISNTSALPQFMVQHNSETLDPTDAPNAVPTASQASSDHTSNPKCAHNPIATQCNQSQYLTLMKPNSVHNPSTSQASKTFLSNSLASSYPPHPGEHVLKWSATSTGEHDISVQWFKFIHPSTIPRMAETPVMNSINVVYSPIASMNYQWTINLHDGYPLLPHMQPEGYIPPSIHTLSKHKLNVFHLGDAYICSTKILLPLETMGRLWKLQPMGKTKINDDLYKFGALNGHQRPPKTPDPNLKKNKYHVLVTWATGEKTYEPLSVLEAGAPVTFTTYDG